MKCFYWRYTDLDHNLHCCFEEAVCSDVYMKEPLGTFPYFPLLNGLVHLLLFF